MIQMNRHKIRWLTGAVFVVVFIIALVASSAAPALANSLTQGKKATRIAYHDEWRQLWEDHITWTRVVIIGIL